MHATPTSPMSQGLVVALVLVGVSTGEVGDGSARRDRCCPGSALKQFTLRVRNADPCTDRSCFTAQVGSSVVTVDHGRYVQDFFAGRRARLRPEQAKLPSYGDKP
jgi:hypothetical protein